jgi:hypothetical protein
MANDLSKLLILSKPKTDENLLGYILRLSELNYCETPNWLLKVCGIGNYYGRIGISLLVETSKELSIFSRIINISETELLALAYKPINIKSRPDKNLFLGWPIPRYLIRSLHPKVCPGCLRESNYCRKIWDLAPVTACPIHKQMLLDKCPNCGKRIKWQRKRVSVCICKYDWRNYASDTVETPDLKVTLQIYRICKLLLGSNVDSASNNNPLLKKDLESFIASLFLIASQYEGASNSMGTSIHQSVHNQQLHLLMCRAFSVFEGWPNSFYSYLDWLRERNNGSGEKYGVVKDFGGFFYRRMMSPEFGFIKEAFDEYLCTYWDGGHLSRLSSLSADICRNKKYISRLEARELLKTDFVGIDRHIEQGRLRAIVRKVGNKRVFFIELLDARRLKRELDEALSMDDVIEQLGVGIDQVLDLITDVTRREAADVT